jgi:hypothetical protein
MSRAGLARAHEKSRTSTRRFTGPLHYRCATWANLHVERAAWSRRSESNRPVPVWRTELSPGLTGLAVPKGTWFLESPSALLLRSVTHTCIGSDSNRRVVRVRAGCNPILLPMHLEPGPSGSCRTRRSKNCARSASMWVPPSGIEPEPLGLQPSAQTNYARVGYERRAFAVRAAQIIIIFFDCQRAARAARTSSRKELAFAARAPRASVHPPLTRAHLSRFEISIRDQESQNSDCV